MPRESKLTSFLIALAHSPELLERFNDDAQRERLLAEWDLAGHPALQPESTLEDVQAAVAEEHEGAAQVAWWILVGKAPIPNPWIIASDEGDDGEYGGGAGGEPTAT